MKFTQVYSNAFKEMALNAGILVDADGFDPSTGALTDGHIIGATSGGCTFSVTPTYKDFGDDVDNCPKNLKGFKKLDAIEAKLSGTTITFNSGMVKRLIGAGVLTEGNSAHMVIDKITPKDSITDSDFETLWYICDYSDINDDVTSGSTTTIEAGFIAIKLNNAINTKGFELKTQDKNKATGSFEFLCHYDNATVTAAHTAEDNMPFVIYVGAYDEDAQEEE